MPRIYMGGAESFELLDTLLRNGSTDVALSFFYLQQRGAMPRMLALLAEFPHVNVFLDSGTTTYLKKDRGNPQIYWRAYYEFLKRHGHRFEYALDFNIEGHTWRGPNGAVTVSREQVEVWREDLQELGTVAIVPSWTPAQGKEVWEQLVHDPQYSHLAIGDDADISTGGDAGISPGGRGDARISKGGDARISKGEGGQLIAQAHAWNKTVHGTGQFASVTDLTTTRVDTLTSSTWLVGQKFGDLCIFEGGHYSRLHASNKEGKKARKKYRRYFVRIGVDPDKIEQDDRQELNKANIWAWLQFAKRVQLTHVHKGPRKAPSVPVVPTSPPIQVLPPEPPPHRQEPPQDSVSIEKTEDPAIVLPPTAKTFMPAIAPSMMCATCVLKNECPKYGGEDAVCAFQADFAAVSTRDANEVVEELAAIFSVNVERARFLRLWEQINGGGMINPDVTKHMEQTFGMGAKLAELMKGKKSVKTTAQGSGMISRIFFGESGGLKTVVAGEDAPVPHALPEHYEDAPEDDDEDDIRTARQKRQLQPK